MAHLYRCQEWQSPTGKWNCNDVQDLAGISGKWWVPARMLNLSLTDYILLLKNKFNATIVKYNKEIDFLNFHWESYTDCHRYVLWINAESRKRQFFI